MTLLFSESRLGFQRLFVAGTILAFAGLTATAQEAPSQSGLKVAEYQLGTSVENRLLKGAATRFVEGTQVFFWTRLTGGQDGDRVRHVWIYDGKEISVGLSVGAASWRTWSSKTLRPGSIGSWAVEVRDTDGVVLARAEFACVGDS